jgi:membrane protease YdiL (CAAX protease family)
MHLFPGYQPFYFTPQFRIGLDGPITGLLPLALLVPLAHSKQDWKTAAKGLLIGCACIGALAGLAAIFGAAQWHFKLLPFMAVRFWSNLMFTSIPEEAFFRGFMQNELVKYFKNTTREKLAALFLTSIIFTLAHVYWSPNIAVLSFVFFASLLYGGVYLISGKIESAILTHFLLNIAHMIFFEYHAA